MVGDPRQCLVKRAATAAKIGPDIVGKSRDCLR
jgi:hypothetical protein